MCLNFTHDFCDQPIDLNALPRLWSDLSNVILIEMVCRMLDACLAVPEEKQYADFLSMS